MENASTVRKPAVGDPFGPSPAPPMAVMPATCVTSPLLVNVMFPEVDLSPNRTPLTSSPTTSPGNKLTPLSVKIKSPTICPRIAPIWLATSFSVASSPVPLNPVPCRFNVPTVMGPVCVRFPSKLIVASPLVWRLARARSPIPSV